MGLNTQQRTWAVTFGHLHQGNLCQKALGSFVPSPNLCQKAPGSFVPSPLGAAGMLEGRHTQDGQKRGRGEMGGSADHGQGCRMDKAGEAGRRFHGSLPSTIPGVVSEPGAANEAVSNEIHIYNSSCPDLAETAGDSGACPGISASTESNCNTSCSSCSCQEGGRHVLVTSQCVPHMVLPLRATPAAAVFRTR